MPFSMFKALSGSRNRTHRGDPAIYTDYPQGYPPAADFQPEPMARPQPQVLRRPSTKRREPLFTPLPSRTPSDAEDYNEGYVRVDSPDAVMRGALNARPAKMDPALPPIGSAVESPLSETFSEREHREHAGIMHDVPRLLDRPASLQRGSFHSGYGERLDAPVVMATSPSSGSDHTVEALRTPPLMHPSERVIPPLPRNYAGSYAPHSRSPTDIYGSRAYDVVHNIRSHHSPEHYHGGHGRANGYEKDGPIYYVIPGGMNVIFQDEYGNEITRVGDFSGRSRPSRPGPFVVQDEHGRELYRYDGYDRRSHRGYNEPQIVRIDAHQSSGQLMSYSSHGYRPDPSYRRGYDYHPDYREYRDKHWRDNRDNRYRGYADHSGYGEYREPRGYGDSRTHRDYGGYREHNGHRDYGGYREHDGYREHGYREPAEYVEHGDYRLQARPEAYPPGRVSSRGSHRTHASQVSMERSPHQYSNSIHDDRRSGRDYASSHASMRHPEDEDDISGGLQALQI